MPRRPHECYAARVMKLLPVAALLCLCACDTSRIKHVDATATSPGIDEVQPDANQEFKSGRFSPDGTRIAFHALMDGKRDVVA